MNQTEPKALDPYEERLAALERRLLAIEGTRGGAAPPSSAAVQARPRSLTAQAERFGLIGAWIALVVIFGAVVPEAFLSWLNFSTMFSSQAVLVVLTLGLLIPLTTGDFDLSAASTLMLSSMTIAVLNAQHGWGPIPAVAVALGCGSVGCSVCVGARVGSDAATVGRGVGSGCAAAGCKAPSAIPTASTNTSAAAPNIQTGNRRCFGGAVPSGIFARSISIFKSASAINASTSG